MLQCLPTRSRRWLPRSRPRQRPSVLRLSPRPWRSVSRQRRDRGVWNFNRGETEPRHYCASRRPRDRGVKTEATSLAIAVARGYLVSLNESETTPTSLLLIVTLTLIAYLFSMSVFISLFTCCRWCLKLYFVICYNYIFHQRGVVAFGCCKICCNISEYVFCVSYCAAMTTM